MRTAEYEYPFTAQAGGCGVLIPFVRRDLATDTGALVFHVGDL
jgi:hypothetical protein